MECMSEVNTCNERNKKIIVMIGNMSWGMHKFRGDLMSKFVNLGHRVVVIAPRDDWSKEIETLGCEFISLKLDRKGVNPFKDAVYLLKLTKILVKLRADIVLAYTIKPVLYGSIASWLAGVPQRIAITTGLGYTFSVDNWISYLTKRLYKFSLIFSSKVWFLNQDDLSLFLNEKLISPSKSFILPGEGVDVEYYKPLEKINNTTTFTLISRMLWDKGVGHFAECAIEIRKTHPHMRFLIVGPIDPGNPEGIPVETLEDWNRKGHVSYLGAKNDVREILKETSCLVHPTYYKEGLPRILLEACAMGVPCITTDIPGCREVIIHQKTGFLIRPKDQNQLKEAIIEFMKLDKEKIEMLSSSSREHILEKFSSAKIFQTYQEHLFL